ncbi:MAG: pantetheine-phosphate adenylyltransferase [Chloroflexota bacterium]|nr:pantetheine-phosphate adenylyltransferase [Chloroflexota bacterium]MDE2959348.1 pantetheine-phosphate adenylyltransferase [Chloroflexota bacterium]
MVTALYPGTFDPVTMGHLNVARRAARLFDNLIVAVYDTPSKSLLFNTEERVGLMREAVADLSNVTVRPFNGLVVNTARDAGAAAIIRGLRSGPDFEYESQMFFMNRQLEPEVDMVSLMSDQEHMFISSSLLKEVAQLGGDISGMVPDHVARALAEKYQLPQR